MSTIERPARRPAWLPALILVAVLALLGPLGWRVGLALAGWAPLIGALLLGVLLLLLVAGLRLVNAYVRGIEARARQAELVTLQSGQPVHLIDAVTVGQRAAGRMLERHYDVELMRASGGQLAAQPAPMITVVDAAAQTAPAQLSAPETIDLARARERGLSGPDQWYVGQAEPGPATISLHHAGLVAIGGVPGTGKTSSAAWLAAQCAAAGGTLYVCDPHHGDPESLSAAIAPFAGAVGNWAVTPEEINQLILTVWRIYDRRCKEPIRAMHPILLLVDEFLDQVLGQRISTESVAALTMLAAGARKKQINGVVCSANWGLGSKVQLLRQSISHALIHRSAPESSRFLCSGVDAAGLAPGEALLIGSGAPVRVVVPQISRADQLLAARLCGRPPKLYTPWGAPPTLAPTVPIGPIAAAPPPPPAPPTNQQRIIGLLGDGTWRTNREIADALGVDTAVITTETKALYDVHQLKRRACKRGADRLEYGQPTT